MTRPRTVRRLSVALASTALVLGAAAAPVASGAATSPAPCADPDGSASARGDGSDHRDVSRTEQRAIERRTDAILAAKGPRSGGASKASIPVYVHVMIGKDGAGDVTDAQVDAQVAVLNQTYAGHDVDSAAGPDTGIGFALAGVDRIVNDQWHHDRKSTTYRAQTRQGGANALNIWVVDFRYLGIATFPWDYATQGAVDGIRVNYKSLPGGSAAHYDQGETATHEAGHWLGLFHTFQGGCTPPGDEVEDTAPQASPSSGCPTGRDSCTGGGLDPIHNYMDYSYDSCYFEFTPGQSTRMDQMWTAYRA